MKRSNFIIGLGLSAVLHGALLYMLLGGSRPTPPPAAKSPAVTPIQIASAPEKLPVEPVRVTAPEAAPPPVVPSPAEALPLEQVVQPPPSSPKRLASIPEDADTTPPRPQPEPAQKIEQQTQETEAVVDSTRTLVGTGDFTPPLRVHWRDAG